MDALKYDHCWPRDQLYSGRSSQKLHFGLDAPMFADIRANFSLGKQEEEAYSFQYPYLICLRLTFCLHFKVTFYFNFQCSNIFW